MLILYMPAQNVLATQQGRVPASTWRECKHKIVYKEKRRERERERERSNFSFYLYSKHGCVYYYILLYNNKRAVLIQISNSQSATDSLTVYT
jgi:hypothetical protein